MEGYIALSRATDAEGVILAQPFAPTLFKQGAAPYPTLLLKVLKGHVSQLQLERKLKELQHDNVVKLLKDDLYKCGCCNNELPASRFIRIEKSSEAYVKSIVDNILMLGACSVCFHCKVGFNELTCSVCEQSKPRNQFAKKKNETDYSESRWFTKRNHGSSRPIKTQFLFDNCFLVFE